jgi:hypothetical protein
MFLTNMGGNSAVATAASAVTANAASATPPAAMTGAP